MAIWIWVLALGVVGIIVAIGLLRSRSAFVDLGQVSRSWVMDHRSEERHDR